MKFFSWIGLAVMMGGCDNLYPPDRLVVIIDGKVEEVVSGKRGDAMLSWVTKDGKEHFVALRRVRE